MYDPDAVWTPTDQNDPPEDSEGDEHCDIDPTLGPNCTGMPPAPTEQFCGLGMPGRVDPDETHPEWRDEPLEGGAS